MTRSRLQTAGLVLSAALAVVILVGTLNPQQEMPAVGPPWIDKLFHFIGFAALVFPAVATRPAHARWLVPAAIALGGAIELIQPSVGRHAEWGDFIANSLGAGFGALTGWAAHAWLVRPLRAWRAQRIAARAGARR